MKQQIITKPSKIQVFPEKEPPVKYKVILIGEPGVGKTSFMNKYIEDRFTDKYSPTVAVDYNKKCIQQGKDKIDVILWDFSGMPEFSEVRNEFYREANLILLIYDITSKKSFEVLDMWVREAGDQGTGEIPFALIGNKKDLQSKRVVSENDGSNWARSRNYNFYEISTSNGSGIEDCMNELIKKVHLMNKQ